MSGSIEAMHFNVLLERVERKAWSPNKVPTREIGIEGLRDSMLISECGPPKDQSARGVAMLSLVLLIGGKTKDTCFKKECYKEAYSWFQLWTAVSELHVS